MYKVFVDTNVVFEHALQRENYRDCIALFSKAEDGRIDCLCSSASFYVFSYVLRKNLSHALTVATIKDYLSFLHIIPTSQSAMQQALASSFKDLEDGFQYYTALNNATHFITYNKKDFQIHQLPELLVYTPSEFLYILG